MGQLSQLVLLASIVASCISYSVDPTENIPFPEPPVDPSESDFLEYPTEFMAKLIASLSPEELEELQKPIILAESNLGDRNGNTDITPCRKKLDPENYHFVKATDGEHYIVVDYQRVEHYACDRQTGNDADDNKCKPSYPQKFNGYCCYQQKAKTMLQVIPVPQKLLRVHNKNLYRKDTNNKYELMATIKKEVEMNSDCICKPILDIVYDNKYSCPSHSKFSSHWNV